MTDPRQRTAGRRVAVPDTQAQAASPEPGTVGICLSGGGIRAAAYGLGALQAMQENGILTGPCRAEYLSAVSGGSYIATAVTLVAQGGVPGEPGGEAALGADDPFARGTPEEQYVRDHTTYLVHGPGGRLVYAGRLLGGILLNVLFVALVLHFFFRPAGWVYGWLFPSLRRGYERADVSVHIPVVAWMVPVVLLGLGLLVGLVQIAVRWPSDEVRKRVVVWCRNLLVAGLAAAVLVGIPLLLEFIRDVVARLGGGGGASANGAQAATRSRERLSVATGGGLAGAVATALWALRARATAPSTLQREGRWLLKKLRTLAGRSRVLLLNLLATVFGPLLLLSIAVFFLDLGAANTVFAEGRPRVWEIVWFVGLGVLLAAMYYFADLVSWSLQPLYKRRLSSTFALRRVRNQEGRIVAEERPYSALYPLSQSQPAHMPKFLICAAANISDYGVTATGSNVGGFVFGGDEIGGPVTGSMPTEEYEATVGRRARDFTLPAAMSISGAAISPSMGKMTRPPIRFLLALLNVRLGVWIPNPRRFLHADVGDESDRKLALSAERPRVPVSPRPLYLLRELFGRNHLDAQFIYVSDGGHYENLGLVELLRRGCTTIWCVDASGEAIDTFGTIADAVSIARSELAVDIDIDPRVMAPDPAATGAAARFVRRTHLVRPFRYHDGTEGTLVLIKAGVPEDAPADVLQAHASWKAFPCDPTSNQLYTAERFDAYRALGYFSTCRAFADPAAPPPVPRVPSDGSDVARRRPVPTPAPPPSV